MTKNELVHALRGLLEFVDRNTCGHEDTHRAGVIWTVCDGCGMKWADDEGGFVAHTDAPAVAQARAALSALANAQADAGVVEKWQPIETAPRDGTDILVWAEGYNWPEVVRYVKYDDPHLEEETGEPGYWRYSDEVFADILQIEDGEFTHWSPLPAPPSTRIAGRAEQDGSAIKTKGQADE